MSEDFSNLIHNPIQPTIGPKSVDPDRLQQELQRAFSVVDKKAMDAQALSMAQISLHKMVIRALVDLDFVERSVIFDALTKLASQQKPELAREVLKAMSQEYAEDSEGHSQPNVRLVVSNADKSDQ